MNAFSTPATSLGDLDADAAATLIAAASDVALILDADGTIRDLAVQPDELRSELESRGAWTDRPFADTVTIETRPKVAALLRAAASNAPPRWRQVNHATARGPDVPILYAVVQLREGRMVAFGRDLRAMSEMQQRLVDAQQSMERDYSRLRNMETRYRLLFEMSSEAVLIVEAASAKVVEANPSARLLFGERAARLLGRPFKEAVDPASGDALDALLAAVRAVGRTEDVSIRLANGTEVIIGASQFRHESSGLLLVRLTTLGRDPNAAVVPRLKSKLIKVVESAPDGFVVSDAEGSILTANGAFLEMAQLASEEQARGESLDRWIGRAGVDLAVLIANLRQRGAVRLFATTIRGEFGQTADVEISAVSVVNGGQPCLGFAIRNIGGRLTAAAKPVGAQIGAQSGGRDLPRSIEQLTELIGRVSLKDLVRDATDVIERLAIETALDITNDNRASAAEMLGLSRQSLYVKLRRYGLGELTADEG